MIYAPPPKTTSRNINDLKTITPRYDCDCNSGIIISGIIVFADIIFSVLGVIYEPNNLRVHLAVSCKEMNLVFNLELL